MITGRRVAIVTGAGSGIGFATAKLLSSKGFNVVIAEKDVQKGKSASDEISRSGGRSIFVQVDVSKREDTRKMAQEAVNAFGRIDALVNNAAIVRFGSTLNTTEEDWDAVMATNLKGVFLSSQAVVPEMIKSGSGAIVNIASINAINGPPDQVAYSAAKAGVLGLTVVMAKDLAKYNIRVNAIMPGAIDTPMLRSYLNSQPNPEKATMDLRNKRLLKRFGRPEDVANAVSFLVSEESEWVTGTAITVDGGELLSL